MASSQPVGLLIIVGSTTSRNQVGGPRQEVSGESGENKEQKRVTDSIKYFLLLAMLRRQLEIALLVGFSSSALERF